jgi:hypothetical protein
MSEAIPPRLGFAAERRHPGNAGDHNAGRDQRVFTNYAGRHSDGIARNQCEQQCRRCGRHHAQDQVKRGHVHRRKEIFTHRLRICRRINEGMLTS